MNKELNKIHFGERIQEVFKQTNMNVSQFARLLGCDRANVYNIFRRKKIDIYLLSKISNILHYNFVEEFSEDYEAPQDTAPVKISFVVEINSIDSETLKILLKLIKQLDIKTIREIKS